jgi:1,4-alpha-glucan branching enzyme
MNTPTETVPGPLTRKPANAPVQAVRRPTLRSPLADPKPAVQATARVVFELAAPAAGLVFVVGSFNGWQVAATPLRAARDGRWRGELKLTPGRYEYLFVVDGTWVPDPAAPEVVPNPFGGWNSVLSVN